MDRFEVIRTLSQGGMADLFLARERTTVGVDRLVALKRLRLKYQSEPDFADMFLDECRLALRLEHPRIVRAYGVDVWEGSPCLALEYLRGCDVGSLMESGLRGPQLGLEPALTIGHAVADALAYAHQITDDLGEAINVVHRDVSPANVFVCIDGSIRLIDFGVAAISRAERRTPKGVLKGKYSYMSPEQCRGEEVDRRSDLFSLGVVLYELTTGQRLFRGARAVDIVRQIAEAPIPPPTGLHPDFPPELEELLFWTLEKDADQRPGSAELVRDALVAIARRNGHSLAGFSPIGVVEELSESLPLPRRGPRDTLPSVSTTQVTVPDSRLEDAVVLVVDDEDSFQAVAKSKLRDFRRIAAYNLVQALDAVATNDIDVMILDLNLPDRNGLEMLEELRRSGQNIKVIVCTAQADVGVAVECMKRGAFDFLVKTHETYQALNDTVRSALRHRAVPPSGDRSG